MVKGKETKKNLIEIDTDLVRFFITILAIVTLAIFVNVKIDSISTVSQANKKDNTTKTTLNSSVITQKANNKADKGYTHPKKEFDYNAYLKKVNENRPSKEHLTTSEFGKKLGIKSSDVRELIYAKVIKANKIAGVWFLHTDQLKEAEFKD